MGGGGGPVIACFLQVLCWLIHAHDLNEPYDSLLRELLRFPFYGWGKWGLGKLRTDLKSDNDEVAELEVPGSLTLELQLLSALGWRMLLRPGHVWNHGGWRCSVNRNKVLRRSEGIHILRSFWASGDRPVSSKNSRRWFLCGGRETNVSSLGFLNLEPFLEPFEPLPKPFEPWNIARCLNRSKVIHRSHGRGDSIIGQEMELHYRFPPTFMLWFSIFGKTRMFCVCELSIIP